MSEKNFKEITRRFIRVQVVSVPEHIVIYNHDVMYLDLETIMFDGEGNTYGEIYDAFGYFKGFINLKHFKSVTPRYC